MYNTVLKIKKVITLLEDLVSMSRFGCNSKAEDILVKAKVLLELIIADIQKNS